jgi:hypothetical protein
MKPEIIALIGVIVILVLGLLVVNNKEKLKEGFDFIKPYQPSDLFVPSVTNADYGAPSMISTNYDRIVHPSEVCVYREPRDGERTGQPSIYGIGFSQNLPINRDTYLNVFDMYDNRLATECHPSQLGPVCDYLERVNPLFKGVSTFGKKPFEPNRLGTRAAKTVDELRTGADPLDALNYQDGYYRPSVESEKFTDSFQTPVTESTVSSYDNAIPSDLKEYNHTPKIIHPSESVAYANQRATYFKNPYKLGFSKSSIVNRDTYHDNFDRYERREPALCHPSNLNPLLDHLRTAHKETFSSGMEATQANNNVPSNDTWDLKDPRICSEKRVGCPRTNPKLPLKIYSKCYEHNRSRLVNPIIDVDPYQYW